MDNKHDVLDNGPFFHGTKAELKIGDLLKPQHLSNYQDKKSNYIYFTVTLNAAKWGAELAMSKSKERIYIVEPLGDFSVYTGKSLRDSFMRVTKGKLYFSYKMKNRLLKSWV